MSFTAVLKADSEPYLQSGWRQETTTRCPNVFLSGLFDAMAGAQVRLTGSAHSSDCHVCSIVGHAGVSLYARREAQQAP